MKYIIIFLFSLVIAAPIISNEYSGLFYKYRERKNKTVVTIQLADSSFQKVYNIKDTCTANKKMNNLFKMMEDVLALEDTLRSAEYINSNIANYVEIETDSADYVISVLIWPFETARYSSFWYPNNSPYDTVNGWLYYEKNSLIYASLADNGSVRIIPYVNYRGNYSGTEPYLKMVNCDNILSLGFKGLAYAYMWDAWNGWDSGAQPYYKMWDEDSSPWNMKAEIVWGYTDSETGETDFEALYNRHPYLESYEDIDYLFIVE